MRGGGVKPFFSNKVLLCVALIFNLLLLCFFKYMDFFIDSTNLIFHSHFDLLHIALPLGISFFTITQIAFLVDCFHGVVKERNPINYALFVTFFPHLIAGPILHHKEMMPQFADTNNKILNYKNLALGLFLFAIGLFKKVVIADSFAKWANAGFSAVENGEILNIFSSWVTSLSYTFQLYFDFSGYCDMAVGLGLMFNIRLPINFNSPYKALNITDFWRRWHITLGRFLKAYLYIPLGGNQNNAYKQSKNYTLLNKILTLRNLFIVAFISGIWHGAGFGFIIWGTLHGLAMLTHRIYMYILESFGNKSRQNVDNMDKGYRFRDTRFYKILCWFITFNFINITWVFFRAENVEGALNLLKGMFGIVWVELPYNARLIPHFLNAIQGRNDTIIYLVLAFILCLACKNSIEYTQRFKANVLTFIITMFVLYIPIIMLGLKPYEPFLYFNF
ncbi:MAG: MBOAT family O-acyltransferase [Helicobacter sp.]|nr:MBOAT family O-acyltransferase [Helicobacter sp.]MDY5823013.1 MBOAT family O-acyltransferase [Helicobacter sp.]